ncbi:MAG: hypothetical protein RL375_1050 [Pseudomonadota bacterium]|jgi:uncharacterized protein YfdQ (DUF2303 family)
MDQSTKNIAETLAEVLPQAKIIHETPTNIQGLLIAQAAVPKGSELKEIRLDLEKFLPNPRRTAAKATFFSVPSFLEYVKRHADPDTTVAWCRFDPQTYTLDFSAVFDDHAKGTAGWRGHKAVLVPEFSAEWKAWKGNHAKSFAQVAFAEWIQEHEDDIATANGLPTSLQMLTMATNFVMNEERVLKSSVRLQSGGMRLTYVADPDAGTTADMQMYERFALGIPVFHGGPAWSMGARLKYRNNAGKLSFSYELVRADKVHQGAAMELIEQVRAGLGAVPFLMGSSD